MKRVIASADFDTDISWIDLYHAMPVSEAETFLSITHLSLSTKVIVQKFVAKGDLVKQRDDVFWRNPDLKGKLLAGHIHKWAREKAVLAYVIGQMEHGCDDPGVMLSRAPQTLRWRFDTLAGLRGEVRRAVKCLKTMGLEQRHILRMRAMNPSCSNAIYFEV